MEDNTVFSTVDKSYIKKCPFTTFASGQQPKNAASYITQICKDRSSVYQNNINTCCHLECESPDRKCYACIKQGEEGPDTCVDPKTGSKTGLCPFHTENGEEARRQRKTEPQEEAVTSTILNLFKKEDDFDYGVDVGKKDRAANQHPSDKTSQKKEVNIVMGKVELASYQIKILEETRKNADQNGHFNKETTQKVAEDLGQNHHSIVACVSQLLRLGMVERLSKGQYRILDKEYALKTKKTKEGKKTKPSATRTPQKKRTQLDNIQLDNSLPRKKIVGLINRKEEEKKLIEKNIEQLRSFLLAYDKLIIQINS